MSDKQPTAEPQPKATAEPEQPRVEECRFTREGDVCDLLFNMIEKTMQSRPNLRTSNELASKIAAAAEDAALTQLETALKLIDARKKELWVQIEGELGV